MCNNIIMLFFFIQRVTKLPNLLKSHLQMSSYEWCCVMFQQYQKSGFYSLAVAPNLLNLQNGRQCSHSADHKTL